MLYRLRIMTNDYFDYADLMIILIMQTQYIYVCICIYTCTSAYVCIYIYVHNYTGMWILNPPPLIVLPYSYILEEESEISMSCWIQKWHAQIAAAPNSPQVPLGLAACSITTPLLLSGWWFLLRGHPHPNTVHFMLKGISKGFRIGYSYGSSVLTSAKQNLQGAVMHPDVVEEYLQTEIRLGRLVGPFPSHAVPNVHISRFGVIPKSHQVNKWRLIVDLSFPADQSINDGIPKELYSLKYITIDDAVEHIVRSGPGTHLAKIDIKSTFRLVPVHVADQHLLGVQWRGAVFIDTCLPFGLRSAPKLFNTLADLLAWILEQHGVQPLLHYLDDFLTIGPPHSPTYQQNLDTIKQVRM